MFLVNYLNRSETDAIWPLFECIYAIELFIILFGLLLAYPLAVAVYTTKTYHINIRLRLVAIIFHAVHCSLSRVVIIIHQVIGPVEYVERAYLFVSSLDREAFKGYAVSFTLILACDRWVATLLWSWYESQQPSTILVFIFLEFFQLLISWALSSLLITETITDQDITLCYGVLLILSVACFISVLRYNRREIEVLKKGAQIGSYSVSRSYQFNENVAIMQVLTRIAWPVAQSCVPCFGFYAFYSNYPVGAGLDLLRFISIALFDLWLAISIVNVMLCFLRCEPKFRKSIREYKQIDWIFAKCGVFEADTSIIKVAQQEANTYFSMLSRDLGTGQSTVERAPGRR